MNLLVLGVSGMAGHIAVLRLKELGHTVTGFARRCVPFCETITGDVTNFDLSGITGEYDAVINCIGVLNKAVDANPYKGIWLNSCLPHLLASCSKRVIHISTDCVFSGNEGGGYTENSFRSAEDLYGRSKALGEITDNKNLTFRMSIIGPDINENGVGLFNWFMNQEGTINGYTSAIWTGITTITLADAINAALEQELTGIYHLVNNEKISKYELLKLFNKLKDKPLNITPFDGYSVDKSLTNTRNDFNFKVPSYFEMVDEMRLWINNHKELYPHCHVKD